MKRVLLALLFVIIAVGARAQSAPCVPTQATPGMPGCWTQATSVMPNSTDFVMIWRGSQFPNSAQLITPSNLNAAFGGPFLPLAGGSLTGPLLIGTGSPYGLPYLFQTAINADPSQLLPLNEQIVDSQTLTYSTSTTNVWGGPFVSITVNGPGAANGEINAHHAYLQYNANATIGAAENYEASMENLGTISGIHAMFLSVPHNASTGVITGSLFGTKYQLTNENTTSGAIDTYYAIDNEALAGGGSVPTFYGLIRNADPNGSIVSLGAVSLGSLTPPVGTLLVVQGPDTSDATFPVIFRNSAGTIQFMVDDSGRAYLSNRVVTFDVTGNGSALTLLAGSGQANTLQMLGQATGSTPTLQSFGTDSVVGLDFNLAKGATGAFTFNSTGGQQFSVQSVASSVSFAKVTGAIASSNVLFDVGGTATGLTIGGNTATGIVLGSPTVGPLIPGGITVGLGGTSNGSVIFENTTSGTLKVAPPSGALGTQTLTLPDVTDTLAVIGTAQTFAATQTFSGALVARTTLATGGGTFTLATGEVGLTKISASGSAPGAGALKLDVTTGTSGGTCKIIAYAGTSSTPTTVIDNVGSGC